MKHILFATSTIIFALVAATLTLQVSQVESQTAPNYSLFPASSTVQPGSQQSIQLRINTSTHTSTSFVAAIDVTGNVPANLAFVPIAPSGMTAYHGIADIPGGKQIQLEVVGGAGSGSINTNNTSVQIGTITFTTPSTGTIDFNLNSMSAIYAGTAGDVLASYFSEVYTIQSAPTPTPVPTNTPVPPTATPVPPTTTPVPPTNTPAPSTGNVTINFRLDGITSQVPTQTVRVAFLANNQHVFTGNSIATANTTGQYTTVAENVPTGTNMRLCLKAKSHLQRCFDGQTVPTGTSTLNFTAVGQDLMAGDVSGINPTAPNNITYNAITIEDVSYIQSLYSQNDGDGDPFRYQVTNPDQSRADIDNDGYITINDLALILLRFSDFNIPGHQDLGGDQ